MRPAGQLDRALEAMTLGVHQDGVLRRRMLSDGHTGEVVQQVQMTLIGQAGNIWGSVDANLSFELPFLYAPLQRRSEFEVPHFSHGIEMVASKGTILIHPMVTAWLRSEENWVIGATVRFQVWSPDVITVPTPFEARMHLSFQGYASYAERDEDV